MIDISNKEDCCGCNACGDICAHSAISFKTDHEGFWYPEVDKDKCVDCGLCEKVCPVIQPARNVIRYEVPIVYAAYTKDEEIRLDSTSGGLHSMFAQLFYAKKFIFARCRFLFSNFAKPPHDAALAAGVYFL